MCDIASMNIDYEIQVVSNNVSMPNTKDLISV